MTLLLLPLVLACALTSIVCWILVLIKMFSTDVVQGIIGLICGLWALIWGWQNRDKGLGIVMPIWTVAIIGNIVLQGVTTAIVHR